MQPNSANQEASEEGTIVIESAYLEHSCINWSNYCGVNSGTISRGNLRSSVIDDKLNIRQYSANGFRIRGVCGCRRICGSENEVKRVMEKEYWSDCGLLRDEISESNLPWVSRSVSVMLVV